MAGGRVKLPFTFAFCVERPPVYRICFKETSFSVSSPLVYLCLSTLRSCGQRKRAVDEKPACLHVYEKSEGHVSLSWNESLNVTHRGVKDITVSHRS